MKEKRIGTVSYLSTPGMSAMPVSSRWFKSLVIKTASYIHTESMVQQHKTLLWVCYYLIKPRRTQDNGTTHDRMYSVRDYWITEILASSQFYYISTFWKKRQGHLGFFAEIDDLWEVGSIDLPPERGCDGGVYLNLTAFISFFQNRNPHLNAVKRGLKHADFATLLQLS